MKGRRAPIQTSYTSTVKYPSALFSLERDEVYPYERYAYNVLDIAVEALHHKGLPENIAVDFTEPLHGTPPWSINAAVIIDSDAGGTPVRFRFVTPELFPMIVYLFAARVMPDLFTEAGTIYFQQHPTLLGERIRRFSEGASTGVSEYRSGGFARGVRASYDHLGLTIADLEPCANNYDLLTKLVAYHEVAHAYTQPALKSVVKPIEKSALELIADLLATMWFYRKMIVNTPDTEEYRQLRGVASHSEAVYSNALVSLQSQQALVVLMAIAGAQANSGKVSLSGGLTHPPGLQRYSLQHAALRTLVSSNFSEILSKTYFARLDADWDSRMNALVKSGAVSLQDLEGLLDPAECDTVEVAADLIEQHAIKDLRQMVPWLRDIRRQMLEALGRRQK